MQPSPTPSIPIPARRSLAPLIFALATVSLIRLWLLSVQRVSVLGQQADDFLFVDQARHLIAGQWLGPYDLYLLVKGPGYPLFLAAAAALHLPLLLAQHLFSIAVHWLLVFALRPLLSRTSLLVALFTLLLMSPIDAGPGSFWVVRDAIYPDQCLLAAGCLLGLIARLHRPRLVRIAWALAAGLALGWVYITREEGFWLAPLAVLLLAYATVRSWKLRRIQGRFDFIGIPVWPLAAAGAVVLTISAINYRVYHFFGICEFKEKHFLQAMGAVMRPIPTHWQPRVPVPRDTWPGLAKASPAFASLLPYLNGPTGDAAAQVSIIVDATVAPTRDIVAGLWLWTLRAAAAQAGHHTSAPAASAFYARLATEINGAINAGQLPGGPVRASLAPPWNPGYIPLLEAQIAPAFRELVSESSQRPSPPDGFRSAGSDADLIQYAAFLRETPIPNTTADALQFRQTYESDPRFHALATLHAAYQFITWPLLVLALFAAVFLLLRHRTTAHAILITAAALCASAVTRTALLLYIHVSSIGSITISRYVSAGQYLLLFATVLLLLTALDHLLPRRPDSSVVSPLT